MWYGCIAQNVLIAEIINSMVESIDLEVLMGLMVNLKMT